MGCVKKRRKWVYGEQSRVRDSNDRSEARGVCVDVCKLSACVSVTLITLVRNNASIRVLEKILLVVYQAQNCQTRQKQRREIKEMRVPTNVNAPVVAAAAPRDVL